MPSALRRSLPVIELRNHAYRVSSTSLFALFYFSNNKGRSLNWDQLFVALWRAE